MPVKSCSHAAIDDKGGIVCRRSVVEYNEAALLAARAPPNGREGAFAGTGKTLEVNLGIKLLVAADTGHRSYAQRCRCPQTDANAAVLRLKVALPPVELSRNCMTASKSLALMVASRCRRVIIEEHVGLKTVATGEIKTSLSRRTTNH